MQNAMRKGRDDEGEGVIECEKGREGAMERANMLTYMYMYNMGTVTMRSQHIHSDRQCV